MTPLSPRQQQMLPLLLAGMPTAEIAKSMGVVKHTAALHAAEIYSKLNVSNRAELMATLMQPTEQARKLMGRYAG